MKVSDEPIIIEQRFNTSIQEVWNALTRLEEMKKWYFKNLDSFNPEIGFQTEFEVQAEDRKFTHIWKITDVIPLKRIKYNWRYNEYPGDSYVTFELTEEKKQVKLRVQTEIVQDFPSQIPQFERDSCLKGWKYLIEKNLKEYLEINPG